MSKIKNWMMDMDYEIETAIIGGMSDPDEIFAYVRTYMPVSDMEYVRKQVREILGPEF